MTLRALSGCLPSRPLLRFRLCRVDSVSSKLTLRQTVAHIKLTHIKCFACSFGQQAFAFLAHTAVPKLVKVVIIRVLVS